MVYRRNPMVSIERDENSAFAGWKAICGEWKKAAAASTAKKSIVTIEAYPGANLQEIQDALQKEVPSSHLFLADDAFLASDQINQMISRNLTDDRVFGVMDHSRMEDFLDEEKLAKVQAKIDKVDSGIIFLLGTGASLIAQGEILVYADITRWEIQCRWRRGEACNWLANNADEEQLRKFKRGFFFEWRVADRRKRELMPNADYVLDTNMKDAPKMVTGKAFRDGLRQIARQPFSMVAYFDPGVWGGQWMKEKFDLDSSVSNYAWSFNGVPEENSIRLRYGEVELEIPAIDLVFMQPAALLGEKVYARFGAEFPIRFDFLDTMGGENLSLQVHPQADYIQDRFGMHYTQDESYYLLDCGDQPKVYLGTKTGVNPKEMIDALHRAQDTGETFPDEKYVNQFPVKKHDHVLIPAGTVHCSGRNTMVLEISATPYIFTFKLWDWDRVGLDGKPRPVHIDHGSRVIQWDRDTQWVQRELLHRVEVLEEGDGWREERTGLHEAEFIETRRLWFSQEVAQNTDGGVQMLMVVEGDGCIVSSPANAFPSFVAGYAECFVIPAAVGAYQVSPLGKGQETGLIRAYVRT